MADHKKIKSRYLLYVCAVITLVVVIGVLLADRFLLFKPSPPVDAASLSASSKLANNSTAGARSQVQVKECPFFDTNGARVRCYAVTVFEFGAKKVVLPVVVFGRSQKFSSEALVHIPGGPGGGDQTSIANLEFWSYWYSESAIEQDLVVFNPRGLRGSAPYWNCARYDERAVDLAANNLPYQAEQKDAYSSMIQCIDALSQWQQDTFPTISSVSFFSPQTQAKDVNRIAELLGYDAWHFWGVSFGTRVALLAADHAKVKSLVLDGVYPLEEGGVASLPAMFNRAMTLWESHFRRFNQTHGDSILQNKYSAFRPLLTEVLIRLNENPLYFTVDVWRNAAGFSLSENGKVGVGEITFVLNRQRMLSLLFYVLYSSVFVDSTITALGEYASDSAGGGEKLTEVVGAFVNSAFDEGFNSTLFFMAECSERKYISELLLQQLLLQQYTADFPDWQEWVAAEYKWDVCRHPVFNANEARRQGWEYEQKPTLIVSGELDPVTPPEWGENLRKKIKTSRHVVVKGAAHGALLNGFCDNSFWGGFLQTTNVNQQIKCESF